jgi:monoterpene epsilon-lactone hydrolase
VGGRGRPHGAPAQSGQRTPGGLPPTSVFIGTREIAYPDAADFAQAASAAGVDVELTVADGAVHVYPLVPTPEGADGTRAVVRAVAGR